MAQDDILISDQTGEDDRLVVDSAERLFAEQVDAAQRQGVEAGEWPAALWQRVAEAGFPRLLAAEAQGGFGAGWGTAAAVLRGIGFWQVPLPLAETLVAAQLLSSAGLEVPDGPLTLAEAGRHPTLQVSGSAAQPQFDGELPRLPWARHAQAVVLSLADGRIALLPVQGAAGVALQTHVNHASLPLDTLQLSGARAVAVAPGAWHRQGLIEPAWTLGALARCAQMVGALESALAQTLQYAQERVQFGQAIGRNQAIQQALALMAGDVVAARMAMRTAAADAPSLGTEAATGAGDCNAAACGFSVAVAKVRCGEAATRATRIAHQVHGAIGFTREHALHLATRRLWAWRDEFGSDADWARTLGGAAIRAGAAGFWPGLTERSLA